MPRRGSVQDYIYLDHAATSPLDPRVALAMQPWVRSRFGNPSAQNRYGREADAAIETAREQTAGVLNCRPEEVVFTSGGSESVNAALKGISFAQQFAKLGSHLVVSGIEHHAVLHTVQYLEKFGFETTIVGVDSRGLFDPEEVAFALRPDTAMVSLMMVNNETGTIEPIGEIAEAVKRRGRAFGRDIPLHTDAIQAPLWHSIDVQVLGIDALSLSAHKFGGPTGAGVLYLRRGVPFLAQQSGGGQERQRRSGTEHVAGIVGTGAALAMAKAERAETCQRAAALSQRLATGVRRIAPSAVLNGDGERRVPGIMNFSFPDADGERLVQELDARGVAASSGSACMSDSWEPSHVLLAMGLPMERAMSALRFSFGRETSETDVDAALQVLPAALEAANSLSAV